MDVVIGEGRREDVVPISELWLEALGGADLAGMELSVDAARRLQAWLVERLRDRSTLGLVAHVEGGFAGFLLGRVGEWDWVPPIVKPCRVGRIEVVCVAEARRRQGIGRRLVTEGIRRMEARGAGRIETAHEVSDVPAGGLWKAMGFRPSLQTLWKTRSGER
jgi:ribosomal protein S18 acetylase RimI-like enzyme